MNKKNQMKMMRAIEDFERERKLSGLNSSAKERAIVENISMNDMNDSSGQ